MNNAAAFAAVFAALYSAHHFADYWLQTPHQAAHKADRDNAGRLACARHVLVLIALQLAAVTAAMLVLGFRLNPPMLALGLAANAASHWWADRRHTVASLIAAMERSGVWPGKTGFLTLGAPRAGHDDNPTLGTGAHALDQSWHIAWVFIAALICAA